MKEASLEAWLRAGARLRRVDPRRFTELLELTDQMALAHEDPDAPELRHVAGELTVLGDDESQDYD